jgi:UDPglucose 6-dehydrogenase
VAGKRVALLGLAFKAGTDDVRDSPALALADALHGEGAELSGCDPKAAMPAGRDRPWLQVSEDVDEAIAGVDAVVLATEWPEYLTLDFSAVASRMRGRVLLDARNALDPSQAASSGLHYLALGRAAARAEA